MNESKNHKKDESKNSFTSRKMFIILMKMKFEKIIIIDMMNSTIGI